MARSVARSKARRLLSIPPRLADALLVAVLATLDMVSLALAAPHATEPNALAVVLLLAQTIPLLWRRSHPVVALAVSVVAFMAYNVIGFPMDIPALGPLFALYSVAVYAPRRTAIVTGSIAIPSLLAFVLVGVAFTDEIELGDLVPNAFLLATIWIVGSSLRARRAQVEAFELKAALLEKDREERARVAVADERGRIARELHDVVTHSVSVMVVQAGAARRVLDTSPEKARDAMHAVETTGQQALAEMRRLLGVLRADDEAAAALQPQPGIDQLDALMASVRGAGLPVELTVEGEPRPLPTGVDLSAYRIVQEALTNALKHAGPARAEVVLRYHADAVEVQVRDDGRGVAGFSGSDGEGSDAAGAGGANGAGHGLVGMRERVALFGGSLEAGPRRGGGYAVTARLPT